MNTITTRIGKYLIEVDGRATVTEGVAEIGNSFDGINLDAFAEDVAEYFGVEVVDARTWIAEGFDSVTAFDRACKASGVPIRDLEINEAREFENATARRLYHQATGVHVSKPDRLIRGITKTKSRK